MADDNKPMKYIRYAIGEVGLVVIGILIALQVNNWNEIRKDRIDEIETYENLLTTLHRDSLELINILAIQNKSLKMQRFIIESDFDNLQKTKSIEEINEVLLDICNGIFSFFPKYGTYNSILNSNGIDIMESKRIKGLRANASKKSHAELDESETLDIGNKEELANDYSDLRTLLPNLNIIGGCCGTDSTHLEYICHKWFENNKA